jgi:hypothetical protein
MTPSEVPDPIKLLLNTFTNFDNPALQVPGVPVLPVLSTFLT